MSPLRAAAGSHGFTLVEVLVGLVVLEVGLLGVAGILSLSGEVLAHAARTERALHAAQEVADSLAAFGSVGEGERAMPGGRVRWRSAGVAGDVPLVRIDAVGFDGNVLLVLHAALPGVAGDGPAGDAP